MQIPEPRLGIDIGRVIIDGGSPGENDTSFFGREPLRTPAVTGAFDALARLHGCFDGRVWLVSKCQEPTERRTLAWLRHHDFPTRTGIGLDRIRFCRARPDKAVHCRELAISHFVDDRPDVHEALAGLVPYRYLFGPDGGPPAPGVQATLSWAEAETAILADLR